MDGPPVVLRWTIEPLAPGHALAAGRLVEDVLRREFGTLATVCADADLADMHGAYAGPGRMARVAVADGGVIGVVAAAERPTGALELRRFYVRDIWRGRGVGSALLKAVNAWAAIESYQEIVLTTTDRMDGAMAFYRRRGYVETGAEAIDGGMTIHRFRRTSGMRPIGMRLAPGPEPAIGDGEIAVMVERPRRLAEDWHWDSAAGSLVLAGHYDRSVPVNYGLAPAYLNEADGESLDVIVLDDRRIAPGEMIACRPTGVLWRPDGDHKLLAAPIGSRTTIDVDDAYRARVSSWWDEGNAPTGWSGPDGVPRLLAQCRRAEVGRAG